MNCPSNSVLLRPALLPLNSHAVAAPRSCTGLTLTLLCLSVYQRALPALPFSIALGVSFYLTSRWLVESHLVPLVTHAVYY